MENFLPPKTINFVYFHYTHLNDRASGFFRINNKIASSLWSTNQWQLLQFIFTFKYTRNFWIKNLGKFKFADLIKQLYYQIYCWTFLLFLEQLKQDNLLYTIPWTRFLRKVKFTGNHIHLMFTLLKILWMALRHWPSIRFILH